MGTKYSGRAWRTCPRRRVCGRRSTGCEAAVAAARPRASSRALGMTASTPSPPAGAIAPWKPSHSSDVSKA